MNNDTILTFEQVHDVLCRANFEPLHAHGGGIELRSVEGNRVRIRFTGACRSCISRDESLTTQISEYLRQALGVPQLELRVYTGVSDELIAEAKKILHKG